MELAVLLVMSLMFFTAGFWYLSKLVFFYKPVRAGQSEFSRSAQRFARGYKILATGLMLTIWFSTIVRLFWSVVTQNPF